MNDGLRIALLAFDQVEALDLAGPYEVFTTAARVAARQAADAGPARWQVRVVSRDGQTMRARAGLRVLPDHGFDDPAPVDVLVVPGGVVDGAMRCPATLRWLRERAPQARLTASVCTGVFLLAAAGVLGDEPVTTHWEDLDELRRRFPRLQVREGVRWVEHGRLFSSAGISAGIDLSLHLVARLAAPALTERTARQMDYRWQP